MRSITANAIFDVDFSVLAENTLESRRGTSPYCMAIRVCTAVQGWVFNPFGLDFGSH